MDVAGIALPTAYAIPPLPLTSRHYRVYLSTQVTHLVLGEEWSNATQDIGL